MEKCIAFVIWGLLWFSAPAQAEWVDLSKNLGETDVQTMAVDAKDPRILYAASPRRVYKSTDAGENWKQSLGVRGTDNRIHFILADAKNTRRIFVCSERGIQVSLDAGKSWGYFYRGIGDKAKPVYSLAMDIEDQTVLWVATANGLIKIGDNGRIANAVEGIPAVKVFSIQISKSPDSEIIWASTEKGIYRSQDSGLRWDRVFVELAKASEDAQETSLSQFQIEELSAAPVMSNLIRVSGGDVVLAASSRGIWEGLKNGSDWQALKNARLSDRKINYLAASARTFYAATDRGVFRWDEENRIFKDISDGLESKEVRMLTYDEGSGDLFAATKKGVYRFPKADFKPRPSETAPVTPMQNPSPDAGEILKQFKNEPTVQDIQNVAIEYAEVHPDKIKAWREAAARKALMPTLSFTTNSSNDQNVDIDRGGTNDPDEFIIGPNEKQSDWHAGLSWNLGDLIWNGDQTSIDTRSRLMVELRDDVLNEVTHLYYERRRLQVEMILAPAKELPLQVERQLKLDELTAGIDALTGGYLSKNLTKHPVSNARAYF